MTPQTPTKEPHPLTGTRRAAACLAESIRSLQRIGTTGAHAIADALRPHVAKVEALGKGDNDNDKAARP